MRSLPASIWSFVERQALAGVPVAIRGERNFRREQSDVEKAIQENQAAATEISAEAITSHTDREVARRKSLEEKARSNLTVVSVCSTLVFAGLTFLTRQGIVAGMFTRSALLISFFFSVLYFVVGVICALRALQITRTWIVNLDDEHQAFGKMRELQLGYLELNTLETNIKANWTSVSFSCLRNAVISLLVFAGIVVLLIMHPAKLAATTTLPEATASVASQTVPLSALKAQCEVSPRTICCCDCPHSNNRGSHVSRQKISSNRRKEKLP